MKPIKMTKAMLQNLPDEVFNMFITQINDTESSLFDSMPGGRWFYYFGELTVEAFSYLQWQRKVLTFKDTIFHPISGRDIDNLVHYCKLEGNLIARALYPEYSPDSPARLAGIKEVIMNTGRLPAPIVAIRTDTGIRVLDGCHRLSAAVSCPNPEDIPLDAWIGERPKK
jgi:hypothetical protein